MTHTAVSLKDVHKFSNRTFKPWGYYCLIQESCSDGTQVLSKLLVIKPGQRTSLQVHNHRHETWLVLGGEGKAIIGEHTLYMERLDHLVVPNRTKHRLENTGRDELVIFEVQTGHRCSEDDIERMEDDYDRAN
jgi:mannose-6-phosphate isomerase-like protein (cupin superfamily)